MDMPGWLASGMYNTNCEVGTKTKGLGNGKNDGSAQNNAKPRTYHMISCQDDRDGIG